MWTTFQIIISVTMVVTRSINTLAVKWAERMNSTNSVGESTKFNHPYLQSSFTFLGEFLCLVVFGLSIGYQKYTRHGLKETFSETSGYSPLILAFPAFCDVFATCLMYVGLTLTSAASFQMLRGSIMIFVGILSTIFLRKRLEWYRWFGMLIILIGLIVVGLSDFLKTGGSEGGGVSDELIGDAIVVGAQVIAASQFVYEEKFIRKYDIPALKVVGLEGLFGFTLVILLLIPFGYIEVGEVWGHNPDHLLEDAVDGLTQIGNNRIIIFALVLTTFSIALFNFAGVSITRELSAATRKVLDTLRTLVIWAFSLAVGWQKFHYLQPIGFALLVTGIMIYNDLIFMPYIRKKFYNNKSVDTVVHGIQS